MWRSRSFFPRPAFDDAGGGGGGGGDQKPWYEGKADAEAIGYLQSRGWDKDPVTAAIEAGKAHREATKMLGWPQDQVLRLPKEGDVDGWKAFHQRLGKPADLKEYDFAGVKLKDGKDLPDSLTGVLRKVADSLNLPKSQAPALAKSFLEIVQTADAEAIAELERVTAGERDKLADSWKAGFETNMLVAKRTAERLGVTPEQVTALEKVAGYSAVMNMLRNIGQLIGEDKFIANDKGGNKTMTKEMATARRLELMADDQWKTRYLNGGSAENREMADLIAIEHA